MEQTLYYNGTILTMEPELYAQAVLTRNGHIVAVGDLDELKAAAGDARRVDLDGRTLMPSFIDAHSHFSGCANAWLQCPSEDCTDFDQLVETISAYIRRRNLPPGQWVTVRDFDETSMKTPGHPDRYILDRASAIHPIVLQYRSGHVGVLNSQALKRCGIDGNTPSPAGGRIEKKDGAATGYLEENAFIPILHSIPEPDFTDLLQALEQAQRMYASYGITSVQEGMMTREMIPLYRHLCSTRRLWLDVTAYSDMDSADAIFEIFKDHDGVYGNHFKLGGYKIFLDGSPQSRTAWVRAPYTDGSCGYGTQTAEQVTESVWTAAVNGRQILAHCNGDAAAQQFLDAIERVNRRLLGKAAGTAPSEGAGAVRPVLVHGQLLGLDQLERVKALGVIPSFFVAHVYYWGDTHLKNLGLPRAGRISPAASAGKAGVLYTFHQDSPVIRPDMAQTLWCAVTRRTKAGVILGAQERITALEALRAVTCHGAFQYFEEKLKGTLAPGKLADMVILDENPLEIPAKQLKELKVMETIKEGRCVYRR